MAHPKLMAVCNLTPDSFSGDGWVEKESGNEYQAVQRGNELESELSNLIEIGADVVDVGAESTAPGSSGISQEEEMVRLSLVLDTVKRLKERYEARVDFSIDTINAATAEAAIRNGFTIVNDVSGGRNDARMFDVIASNPSIKYVMMFCKNSSGRADALPNAPDTAPVLARLYAFFDAQVAAAKARGIGHGQLVLDPGMGAFVSSDPHDSLTIMRHIPELKARYNTPVLVGASRKGFLKALVGRDFGPKNRLGSSVAAALFCAEQGADYLRVHDVLATKQFFEAHTMLSRPAA
eukprot:TRINITY_DN22841_c0_g1_i1.p1 TRINITY_DN22841_c0_g1~~TRINITY_DN22841_c0_g1_i1.p1  ORF type:complete len:316 (+),score=128.77 TRINITY_DN22841_c0_g1_i1:71-949(+)